MKHIRNEKWIGKVFVWDDQGLFIGRAGATSLHESPAIKILVSIEDEFRLKTSNDGDWQTYRSAMIAAGQMHAIDGHSKKLALVVLVPEAKAAQPLSPILNRKGISRLPATVVNNFIPIFREFETMNEANVVSEKLCVELLKKLRNGQELLSASIDERVSHSVEIMRGEGERAVSMKEIAASVDLSESRFSHLFSEQVGVSARRYQLWIRLRDAIQLLAKGAPLTQAAHETGFSDSAHLTRTFRQMFGIAPSALLKHSSLFYFA